MTSSGADMLKTKDLLKAVEIEAKRKALLAEVIRLQKLLNEDHIGKRIAITLYDQPARPDRPSQTIAGFDIGIETSTTFNDARNDILAAILGAKNASLLGAIEQLEKLGVIVES